MALTVRSAEASTEARGKGQAGLERLVVTGHGILDFERKIPALQNGAGEFGVTEAQHFIFAFGHVATGFLGPVQDLFELHGQAHGDHQLADVAQQTGHEGAFGVHYVHVLRDGVGEYGRG